MTLVQLQDAWNANNDVNLRVLSLVSDEDFELKPGKGKTIRSNFTHIVSVRKMWLQEKLPDVASQIPKLDWKTANRADIVDALEKSNEGMLLLLEKRFEKPGKGNLLQFFAYAVAHEAHHRSQIEIALRINGREPEDSVLYKLWDW